MKSTLSLIFSPIKKKCGDGKRLSGHLLNCQPCGGVTAGNILFCGWLITKQQCLILIYPEPGKVECCHIKHWVKKGYVTSDSVMKVTSQSHSLSAYIAMLYHSVIQLLMGNSTLDV